MSGRAARVAVGAIEQAVERVSSGTSGAPEVLATIVPPAYTHEPARTFARPERIEAVQGSRLTLTVRGGSAWRVRFGPDALVATASENANRCRLDCRGAAACDSSPRDAEARHVAALLR